MLFGESISLLESLQITLLGMLVVFLGLILLMVVLMIMEKVFYKKPQPLIVKEEIRPSQPVEEVEEALDDLELVAVITAAIASSMGVKPTQLVIRNIVRLPETAPVWAIAGRTEQMNRMLTK